MVGEGEGQEARISFLPWFLGLATHPSWCFRPHRAGPWQVRDPLAAGRQSGPSLWMPGA